MRLIDVAFRLKVYNTHMSRGNLAVQESTQSVLRLRAAFVIISFLVLGAMLAVFPARTYAFTEKYTSYGSGGSVGDVSGTSKSTLWSKVITGSICNFCHYGRYHIDNPNVTVQYAVQVTRASTGERITANSVIPAGERIRFRFKPHVSTDIYWFATGHFTSSPYGDWISSQQLGASAADTVPSEIGGSLNNVCKTKNRITNTGPRLVDRIGFGSLSINAPVKRITGMGSYDCTPVAPSSGNLSSSVGAINGGGLDCVFTEPGAINPVFEFGAVSGHFYTNMGATSNTSSCSTSGANMTHKGAARMGSTKYTLSVPEKTIPFPLRVIAAPTSSSTPTTPTITSSGGACVTGTAHSITMRATDPEGDTVRYLIDWDNDGSADQIVPASGYVSSGTSQNASRTFGTAGAKTVRVRAQDSTGTISPWGSLSFSCAAGTATTTDTSADAGFVGDIDGDGIDDGGVIIPPSIDLSLRAVPSLVRSGATSRITWSATNVTSCAVRGSNGDSWNGINSPVGGEATSPITAQTTYTLTCQSSQGVKTKTAIVNTLPSWLER